MSSIYSPLINRDFRNKIRNRLLFGALRHQEMKGSVLDGPYL
jgi:hypothetical protein